MKAKRGTYLIEFSDGTKIVCGNNYKDWYTHAVEYAWSKFQDNRPHVSLLKSVQYSDIKFVDDGGLKYATPKAYDEVINDVNAKEGTKHIPFKHIAFHTFDADFKRLSKEMKYWELI